MSRAICFELLKWHPEPCERNYIYAKMGKAMKLRRNDQKKLAFLIKRFYFFLLFVAQFSFISAESWHRSAIKLATKTFPNVSLDVNERRKKNIVEIFHIISRLAVVNCSCSVVAVVIAFLPATLH